MIVTGQQTDISTVLRTASPLRATRAGLTVAEADRPAKVKLMAVPGRVPARSARRALLSQDRRIAAVVLPRMAAAWPVAEARLRPGSPRRGEGQEQRRGGTRYQGGIFRNPVQAHRAGARRGDTVSRRTVNEHSIRQAWHNGLATSGPKA